MEKYVQQQVHLAGRISRTTENLRKLGAAKITKGAVQSRLAGLEKNWADFQEQHNQLLDVAGEKDKTLPYFTTDQFATTEEEYLTQKGQLLDVLEKLSRPATADASPSSGGQVTPISTHQSRPLPTISLPKFSGDYSHWKSFRDLFQSLVTNNPSLSDVERLYYLKTSLSGEPMQLLDPIEVTAANFKRAWTTLTDLYENERLLVSARLFSLCSLSQIKIESSSALRKLLNDTVEAVQGLEALNRPVQHWDDWLVHLTVGRLDALSRRDWETSVGGSVVPPTFAELKRFLSGRIHALEAIEQSSSHTGFRSKSGSLQCSKASKPPPAGPSFSRVKTHATMKSEARQYRCPLCSRNHFILHCNSYQVRSPQERKGVVMQYNLCINCLGSHLLRDCKATKVCQRCKDKHHSSLHDALIGPTPTPIPTATPADDAAAPQGNVSTNVAACEPRGLRPKPRQPSVKILLATSLVRVRAVSGDYVMLRALIDPCSKVSLVSERAMQTLRLSRQAAHVPVSGVGARTTISSRGMTNLEIMPHFKSQFYARVTAYILPKLTAYVPQDCNRDSWKHLASLQLADPHLSSTEPIDLLLGAEAYSLIIREGLCRGPRNAPVAQKTALGWILTGSAGEGSAMAFTGVTTRQGKPDSSLCDILQQFWTQEEVTVVRPHLTEEEQRCEEHFVKTHVRDANGKYTVRLPAKHCLSTLGESYQFANKLLDRMEQRFRKDSRFCTAYQDFMQEYIRLGHMTPVVGKPRNYRQVFLPHHGVFKTTGETTKIRVVFNGSQPTTTGISLNECLMAGPNLLPDLSSVLLRWRRHVVVFSSDIQKMYRQIWVHEEDRHLQCILWRANEDDPILPYALKTVTYGLSCAPFLAIRTLRQLSQDEGKTYPIGAEVLLHDSYVDDILSGADSVEDAMVKQRQLTDLLRAGGFPLSRWTSNSQELLAQLPPESSTFPDVSWNADLHNLLGLTWQSSSDSFLFQVKAAQLSEQTTKRSILSQIAKLYDPMGWLAPCIITAKILIQSLWLLQVGWDDTLPPQTVSSWLKFYSELPMLKSIKIPRWLGMSSHSQVCEIHGFGDASEKAYAAVVYLRTFRPSGSLRVSLVTAKTRVAPLKQISLPRLELCAAELATSLVNHVRSVLCIEACPVHLWSDSSTVLSWLQAHPSKWKTYVANRVSRIQTLIPDAHWHHVSSCHNPADCASRGVLPSQLIDCHLWWNGPEFLRSSPTISSQGDCAAEETRLERKSHSLLTAIEPQPWDLVERYSSLAKLLRVTAWCMRFVIKLRASKSGSDSREFLDGALTTVELEKALLVWIRQVQSCAFTRDIAALNSNNKLPQSNLIRLNPFLDSEGFLRVGGRLKHSLLDYDEKHPFILPQNSKFTRLLIESHHRRTLHGGVHLVVSTLRRRFWIIGARKATRAVILRCVPCIRWKANNASQQMGNLPAKRVTPTRPFLHSGVDYAGPYFIRSFKGRGHTSYKAYLAVFVCFSTRAVHLEIVTDYSTEAFLAAYKRFTARRGICATLTSDCGTNFVGADQELRNLFSAASKECQPLASLLANDGTQWRFHPPAAPHFGGLWEAAVKSAKHHLRRVVGDALLTYEEMSTLLSQVEACLNSRPIQALSDDPDDLQALTPGHFLVGTALTTVPEPSLAEVKPARLSHWQRLRQMHDHFWRRWSSEYLHSLQARSKWHTSQLPPQVGDLCIIKHDTLPPAKWALGRIVATHPGQDGLVRVVTVRTQHSTFKRPLVKLCLLPRAAQD